MLLRSMKMTHTPFEALVRITEDHCFANPETIELEVILDVDENYK